MLVGFIAVVVILLVIIGIMSTGNQSGSGGTDQTKATKLLSEVSGIAQSVGFYKTTTTDADYDSLNNQAVIDAGIMSTDALVDSADATKGFASKAVKDLALKIVEATNSSEYFTVTLDNVDGKAQTSSLNAAIKQTFAKLGTGADAAGAMATGVANADTDLSIAGDDGTNDKPMTIVFK